MGKWRTISSGVASAAIMINSVMARFRVLVASLAPFFICFRPAHWATRSLISEASSSVARGWALSDGSCGLAYFLPLLVDCCLLFIKLLRSPYYNLFLTPFKFAGTAQLHFQLEYKQKMSKKFFINNLDTDFGQALLEELVKEPTEDPVHMGTTRSLVNAKPNGVKKILKRQKPKLFRKKIIEQCEVYVYSLNQTEMSDIEFGIETMVKPFQDNKIFILVSDLMVWSDSGRKIKKEEKKPDPEEPAQGQEKKDEPAKDQQEKSEVKEKESQLEEQAEKEQKPIEYTFFEDIDYQDRKPLQKYQYIKEIQDKVLAIKRQNVKVFIVCPGLIYGCGQDNLYPLFKAAWLEEPRKLPYLGEGNNLVPMIHLKDLVKLVIRTAESPPEGPPYLLAFDLNQNRAQKIIVQSVSAGVGSGEVQSVQSSPLFQSPDRFLINIDIKPSKFFVGTPEEPVQMQWTAKEGLGKNINKILGEFCKKHELRPMKLLFLQNDDSWRKNSKIDQIYKVFSNYYRIPVLTIKDILTSAKQEGDGQLKTDLNQQWPAINEYLLKNQPRKLDETMKVFYRAVKWRLAQNDCMNRGFILENFPQFKEELEHVFIKLSSKKLKRKKKPVPKPKIEEPPKVQGQQGEKKQQEKPAEEQKQQQPEQQPQEQAQEGQGPKTEPSFPESIISIKQVGKEPATEVVDFFTGRGVEQLIYDTTGAKDNEIFESLRNYTERNGRPNNYLTDEQQLLKTHAQFVGKENEKSLATRQNEVKQKKQQIKDIDDQRSKQRDQIFDIVSKQGEQEIKKMPFRNYLMEFVVPTLNEGLLEVSNIIPNDPVDLLAEYLYQKSYDF